MTEFLFFDQEGITINPTVDYAKIILQDIVSESLRSRYESKVFDIFDSWDDELYYCQLDMEKKHSTGATPLISLMVAALDDKDNEFLTDYQINVAKLNPGADEFINFIVKEKGIAPYFVTNAYPAASLNLAYKHGIPFDNIYSLGYQRDRREYVRPAVKEETAARVPMDVFISHKKEVEYVLDKILDIAGEMLPFAKERNLERIDQFMPRYESIFSDVFSMELRDSLEYLFKYPESGIMGGHRKSEILKRMGKGKTFAVGDSIVDAQMIASASLGVAMNCTNEHTLLNSKMNWCTTDLNALIPIVDDIISDNFLIENVRKYENDELKIFTITEIKNNLSHVIEENRRCRDYLKKLYIS